MVQAELDFVAHLASAGVPVAEPIRSKEGRFVETDATEAGELIVTCIAEAPGRHRAGRDMTGRWIEFYGGLVGSMHAAASDYAPASARRPAWTDAAFDVGLAAAGTVDPPLSERWIESTEALRTHPAGGRDLLIHRDCHLGNLLVTEEGQFTVVDFDDAAYGTQAQDVAIVLFHRLLGHAGDPGEATRRFIAHFMSGYERHCTLAGDWPADVDRFLARREMEVYWLLFTEQPDDMSPSEHRFMAGRRDRIVRGVPYLGTSLTNLL